jgi:hypothetical protein
MQILQTSLLPNFFIVGAPKCGTTAWTTYLSTNREIFVSTPKEPHFFNTDLPGFRWTKTTEEYLSLFSHADGAKKIGEASVMYLYSEQACENIFNFNPEARILIFVRDRYEFLLSYHRQLLYNFDEDEHDFFRAWRQSENRTKFTKTCREPSLLNYKAIARFGEQADKFVRRFGDSQVRIISFENWTRNPRKTYQKIVDFLGVMDDGREDFFRVNPAHQHRFAILARLTQRPPRLAKIASRALRATLGLKSLRLGRTLRKMNTIENSIAPLKNISVQEEITKVYDKDQILLNNLILRVGI